MGLCRTFAEKEGFSGCSGVVVTHVQVVVESSGCRDERVLSAIDLSLYKEGTDERVCSLGTVADLKTPKQLDPALRVTWRDEDAQDYELHAVTNRDLHISGAVHVLVVVECTGYGFYKVGVGAGAQQTNTFTVSRFRELS